MSEPGDPVGIHPIDLGLAELAGALSTYLVLRDRPLLVDPGPATTLEALAEGLGRFDLGFADLAELRLTHVHLDHAGAAGHLARENPSLRIVAHREAAPHLVDPSRLVASVRRSFGADHDRLWGEVLPIPEDRIAAWSPGERLRDGTGIRPLATPGHVSHHLSFLDEEEGILLAGDALGILLAPEAPVHPATPPPGVDLDAWRSTLDEIAAIAPVSAAYPHFGVHGRVPERALELRDSLDRLASRVVRARAEQREEEDAARFEEETRAELSEHRPRAWVDGYFDIFRADRDWAGVRRYLDISARAESGTA